MVNNVLHNYSIVAAVAKDNMIQDSLSLSAAQGSTSNPLVTWLAGSG